MTTPWYNAERVSQPGSGILNAWRAEREQLRIKAADVSPTPVSEITPGTEMFDLLAGGLPASAGKHVNENTAMAVSAVYAAVALIGGAIAALPFHLYERDGEARKRYDSDLWWLFNESPWSNWTAASAWSYAAQSIGLRGDGFWRIHRASPYSNTIVGFEPLHPLRVNPVRDNGKVVYVVVTVGGDVITLAAEDILHFPGVGFDGLRSITPVRAALRPAAGIALAADEYAGAFFANGARADFALKHPNGKLTPDQAAILRATWASRHGGTSNAHLPAVLTGGIEIQQLTMSAEDAQLLGTRQHQVEEVARIFGVPPHMIGHTQKTTSFGSGVEQMSIQFVRYTLSRYLDPMAQEINRKVWPRSRKYFAEHNRDALMEGDAAAQSAYLSKALGGPGTQGWMAVNEVRRIKNLPPIPGGDEVIRAGAAAAPAPADPPPDPTPNPDSANP